MGAAEQQLEGAVPLKLISIARARAPKGLHLVCDGGEHRHLTSEHGLSMPEADDEQQPRV